ncbi:glycosyltransferase family 1 protein [Photobacterium sanctipauli]|uniref:Glycosyltransferase family 1 protein n=1 Tax=Photobacterium sanctipauli TaxID=1342794 RepID=A0A2T3NSH1_9GAMM|nr:glycosyltransferase [Photobacterium sanctipauli]PSW19155.1 glycosyltransferase family 1 protein [Photobacterium sanctipauli]
MEFLVFGEDWGRHPSSSQHILQVISQDYDVHWINSIGLRQPKIALRDLKRIWEKIRARATPPRQVTPANTTPPATIIKPLVWPMAQHAILKALNNYLLQKQLTEKKYRRVVWAALPSAIDYLDICNSDLVIYYCGDDFSALAGVDHQYAEMAEQRLAERADIILACSPALQRKFPKNKTFLLPHGVHLSHFAKPAIAPSDINLSRPSIGFYGSLNNWLDQALIVSLAHERPGIDFYFIGRQDTDISSLHKLDNIHILPVKPHHQLAGYLQHWTVAILPFIDNDQIRACNPLKLREYIAAGCPVISSDFPAAKPYRSVLTTATSKTQWLAAIDHYCQWSPSKRQNHSHQAQAMVLNESWENRSSQVIEIIKEKMHS